MKDNNEERFPIVDEEGRVLGSATRGECHSGSRLLHPVVHLHVFNSRGEVYLQKRPQWKDIQPGKWDTAVGGHMDYGETPEQALLREVSEELGITDFHPVPVGHYVFDSQRERELVYVNRTVYDGPVRPSADELDGGRFWTLDELRAAMGRGILTPNFESEFQRFFSMNFLPKTMEILNTESAGKILNSGVKNRGILTFVKSSAVRKNRSEVDFLHKWVDLSSFFGAFLPSKTLL